ncbi:hypothetical protein Vadar_013311 [Vaccinium darrowii]|uniref:Uncharacterized protein n=1 Tax=Vaccinium darrowii TaxID=229202 RepID=A0ACB7ZKE5_9ERIC|nr:hypothetical protein Vadar_013311 [Vaccinium darrowii]
MSYSLASIKFSLRFHKPSEESAPEGIVSIWEIADIIEVSEEEVSFLTKGDNASFDVIRKSFHSKLKLLLVTKGPKGFRYYTKTFTGNVEGLKVDAVDTTGAEDAFVGGILAQLAENDTWLEDEKLTKRCPMVCEWLQGIDSRGERCNSGFACIQIKMAGMYPS